MKYFIVVFFLFFLPSCTSLSTDTDRLILLEQYQADQNYGKALALIAETPEEYPQALEIEGKRKLLLDELRSYENQVISRGVQQEQKNDWPAAKKTYAVALEKSGASKAIKLAQTDMLHRFQKKMDALEYEELIITGEWLEKKLFLLQDIYKNNPDDLKNKWRYSRTKNDAQEISMQLVPIAEQMLEQKNISMASRVIPLIVKLSPGSEASDLVNRLNSELQEMTLKKKNDRKKIVRKKDRKRIDSFNKAMAYGDLVAAKRHLSKISSNMKKSVEVERMREHLQQEINMYVQEELSIGDTLYRAGSYEQAIVSWGNIIEIEPGNEFVKNKIKRSTMVVEKLKVLRERQTE